MSMWPTRLGLEPEETADLLAGLPALLELSPSTVKTRLVRALRWA